MDSDAIVWRARYYHPCVWDEDFPPLSLTELLADSVAARPDAPVMDFFGRRYTYADLMIGARKVATGLLALGVTKGDRVGLYLPNVPHYPAAYYGALLAGATVVNYSPLYTVDELRRQVEDSGTKMLFTLAATPLLPKALEVLDGSGLERLVVGSMVSALPRAKAWLYRLSRRREMITPPRDPRIIQLAALVDNDGDGAFPAIDPENDLALLQYTGGTTGTPKGAMLTHQNMTAVARQVQLMDPRRGDPSADRIIAVLPFFHVFANGCILNRTILNGGEIVMLPRFDAGQVLKAIARTRATVFVGVPTMYRALLDHPAFLRANLSTLRICISGGAPLPADIQRQFEAATGVRLVEGYGLTEASGAVSSNPYEALNKAGTIGQPTAGTYVTLVDQDDPTRPPAPGQPGEIVLSGPQVMKGYWRNAQADAETFVDGRLRTGDIGMIDADGYIRVVDRLKDMISVGGFKVYPSRIEAKLQQHPAVRDAIVIGIPDSYRGECPKAFVTMAEGAGVTEVELATWLNPQLGKHEQVRAIEIRPSLPRTLVGKPSRRELLIAERGDETSVT